MQVAPQDPGAADRVVARAAMVDVLREHGIRDPRILAAMGRIRRHRFIPEAFRSPATDYADCPSAIGHGQTISQPYIVAYMTERIEVRPGMRVLEIGTGSGYQAAVLAELGARVFTVECIPDLAEHARRVIAEAGYADRVALRLGNGHQGWCEECPFDAILVACAPVTVPESLVDQLAEGGRMILPVGSQLGAQRLTLLVKHQGGVSRTDDIAVRFVPMMPS